MQDSDIRAMIQGVNRRFVSGEFWLRWRIFPCEICGGTVGTWTAAYFGFRLSESFYWCFLLLCI